MKKLSTILSTLLMGTVPTLVNGQIIGSDTAILVQLLSTTVSQLNELEKLVTNAEKYSERFKQYNNLIQDEYFKAERVLYLSESLAAKTSVSDLGELNTKIRELRGSMDEMKRLMNDYQRIEATEERTHQNVAYDKKLNDRKEAIARSQVDKSIHATHTGRASQLTAQNTGLIYESSIQMHNTQLEILDRLATQNQLMAQDLMFKREVDLEKEKFYHSGSNEGGRRDK